ncbi:hypothetical protein [Burkholderia sp. D-99]|uniref:hypothetical protein n=1 Tax=Burkholderia sp. D-99 TaxID=2717316 RepID=UPI00141F4947|nr:hypothetical protein [Burkholderia sp. D-99]NHV24825.1 hypothetical protein [Burkholderia sp. D-99]
MSLTQDSTFRVAAVPVAEAFAVQCDTRDRGRITSGIACESPQPPPLIDAARERMSVRAWKSHGNRGRISSSTYAGRRIASRRTA